MTTPKNIENLKPNQIFVFGSNLNGNHIGGAAKLALDNFGALEGQGEGLQGQSYAFPTLNKQMEKVTKSSLIDSKNKLYECAKNNPDKQFLVTKVGCGIAGFTEKQMIDIFKGDKPSNIVLPTGWSVIRGYKAFEKGLKCRDYQYKLGKDFYHEGQIELCKNGFHFCLSLGDVYNYYQFGTDIVIGEIETEGDVVDEYSLEKSVTNHIRIIRILNAEEASNNTGHWNTGHSNTGHWNTGHWNTGHRNTGHSNTGHSNTGHWNTGDSNTGDRNTGHSNTGHWNTGDSNTGDRNTGDRNTGHRNTGDRNTGHWNTGDRNNGDFNTKTPEIFFVFNKPCDRELWNCSYKPNFLYFHITEWIEYSDMTDDEKKYYPKADIQGGYLKKYDYKEAFIKSYEKSDKKDSHRIKELPNWDKDIFFEISGIMID